MNIPATIEQAGESAVISLAGGKQVDTGIAVPESDKGKKASFGVRPEDLTISTGSDFLFEGTVSLVEHLGEVTLLYVEGLTEGEPIISKLTGHQTIDRGDKVRFQAERDKLHLFDADGKTYRR
jgi:alpha-glucoside transport system ATP-binding protein